MNSIPKLGLLCCFAIFSTGFIFAGDAEPMMAVRGKVLFADDFKGTALGPKWKGGKLGEWAVKDGVLTCAARAGDTHDPYLYVLPEFEFKDVIVEFGFKFDQSGEIDLCMRDTNSKDYAQGSHVLRATVRPNLAQVVDLREGVRPPHSPTPVRVPTVSGATGAKANSLQ